MSKPILGLVIPCYNEQEVLQETAKQLSAVINGMIDAGMIAENSKMFCVDDGSKDSTWNLIETLAKSNSMVSGIKLAGNVGHQNALMAGLTVAVENCDVTISIDADLQDDIDVIKFTLQLLIMTNLLIMVTIPA
nr:unnamed protein product [uncultured bacterium]